MHGPLSLLADLLRTPGALFVWNWKKTRYRLTGARGRCPCQSPSDSGSAHETACDACMTWRAPRRFQWVCPLLVRGPHGWVCSVDAPHVRPFWGRAAVIILGGLFTAYLAAASAGWLFLSTIGSQPVSWIDVAVPTRWHRVAETRADSFSLKAAELLQANDFSGVELSVQSALQIDPGNYEAILFLAHLKQYRQNFHTSDALFRHALDTFPDRAAATSVAWHDALLIRQRYAALATLSLQMATEPNTSTASWVRSVLFALRLEKNLTAVLLANTASVAALPAPVAVLVRAEELARGGSVDAAVRLLSDPQSEPLPPYLIAEYVGQLLALKQREAASAFFDQNAGRLAPFDRTFVQMRLDQASGDPSLVRLDFAALLRPIPTAPMIARLAAWLVEYPDLLSFRRLDELMRKPENQSALFGLELWAAAVSCGAPEEADYWARRAGGVPEKSAAPDRLEVGRGKWTDPAWMHRLLATGKFPREVIFSLLRSSAASQPAAPKKAERRR